MKRLLLILAAAALTACDVKIEPDARKDETTSNPRIPVTLLFEHDGVKVYKFRDWGKDVYYTDARGRTAWQTTTKTGKNTTRTDDWSVETVEAEK